MARFHDGPGYDVVVAAVGARTIRATSGVTISAVDLGRLGAELLADQRGDALAVARIEAGTYVCRG